MRGTIVVDVHLGDIDCRVLGAEREAIGGEDIIRGEDSGRQSSYQKWEQRTAASNAASHVDDRIDCGSRSVSQVASCTVGIVEGLAGTD